MARANSGDGAAFVDPTARELAGLHPAVRAAAVTLIVAAREAGIPMIVISGLRDAAHNAEIGGAPRSLHLDQRALVGEPGAWAFDVAVAGYRVEELPAWWWQLVGEWAEQNLGLFWGGRFEWGGRPDVNHFDGRRVLLT